MQHKKRFFSLLTAGAMALSLLAGCGSNGVSEDTSSEEISVVSEETSTAADEVSSEESKHMTVALGYFGEGLDPAESWNGWTLARTAIGETLVKLNEDMEIEGVLADSWENVDEVTWTFHIREGVTFQNGNEVTAESVKASLERALAECDRAYSLLPVASVEADGQNLTIVMEQAYGATLGNLADPVFTVIDTSADLTDINTAPVFTGPFRVVSYVENETIEVEAYEDYWGGASDVDTVTYVLIRDSDTLITALQSGEVDLAYSVSETGLDLFEDDDAYEVSVVSGTRTELVWINYENEVLSDLNVRQALAYSIDREELSEDLLGAVAATGAFPSSLPFGNEKLTAYDYNADTAVELLAESGYVDSDGDGYVEVDGNRLELELVIKEGTDNNTEAAYLQSAFAAIGIYVNITLVDNVLTAMSDSTIDWDLCVGNINTGTTGDPQYFLELYFTSGASENYGGYSDTALDDLIAELSTEMDAQNRYDIAAEAQQMILDDCPYLFLGYTTNNVVCKSNVTGAQAYAIDYYVMSNTISIN